MAETLNRSTLRHVGDRPDVNLERAVTTDRRLGGHIVQGHVDGTGRVVSRTPSAHWEAVRIALSANLGRYVVEKGSIAVDGVSLTVSGLGRCRSGLVRGVTDPDNAHRHDVVAGPRRGEVNLEVDVIAKYVERLIGSDRAFTRGKHASSPGFTLATQLQFQDIGYVCFLAGKWGSALKPKSRHRAGREKAWKERDARKMRDGRNGLSSSLSRTTCGVNDLGGADARSR